MRSTLGRLCARTWVMALILSMTLAGRGQPVREDRSINWSGEGKSGGFQHGQEGIIVADKDGKLKNLSMGIVTGLVVAGRPDYL